MIAVRPIRQSVTAAILVLQLNSPAAAALFFWADEDTHSIRSAQLDGTSQNNIATGLVQPRGLALDANNSKLYWTDAGTVPRSIQRSNLDGSAIETVLTISVGALNQMALDLVHEKIYFTDSIAGIIYSSNLDGSDIQAIASGVSDPVGIGVDPIGDKVYWTGGSSTQRANLDGTGIESLLAFGARDVELDLLSGKMYVGGNGQQIQRANLDGTGLETLVTTTGFSQMGVDFTGGKIYWSDLILDKIQRSNLDGTNVEDVGVTGLSLPRDIVILNSSPVPEPSSGHICLAFVLIAGLRRGLRAIHGAMNGPRRPYDQ